MDDLLIALSAWRLFRRFRGRRSAHHPARLTPRRAMPSRTAEVWSVGIAPFDSDVEEAAQGSERLVAGFHRNGRKCLTRYSMPMVYQRHGSSGKDQLPRVSRMTYEASAAGAARCD